MCRRTKLKGAFRKSPPRILAPERTVCLFFYVCTHHPTLDPKRVLSNPWFNPVTCSLERRRSLLLYWCDYLYFYFFVLATIASARCSGKSIAAYGWRAGEAHSIQKHVTARHYKGQLQLYQVCGVVLPIKADLTTLHAAAIAPPTTHPLHC